MPVEESFDTKTGGSSNQQNTGTLSESKEAKTAIAPQGGTVPAPASGESGAAPATSAPSAREQKRKQRRKTSKKGSVESLEDYDDFYFFTKLKYMADGDPLAEEIVLKLRVEGDIPGRTIEDKLNYFADYGWFEESDEKAKEVMEAYYSDKPLVGYRKPHGPLPQQDDSDPTTPNPFSTNTPLGPDATPVPAFSTNTPGVSAAATEAATATETATADEGSGEYVWVGFADETLGVTVTRDGQWLDRTYADGGDPQGLRTRDFNPPIAGNWDIQLPVYGPDVRVEIVDVDPTINALGDNEGLGTYVVISFPATALYDLPDEIRDPVLSQLPEDIDLENARIYVAFAHLEADSIQVEPGDTFETMPEEPVIIGRAGNTGNSPAGPHLDLGVALFVQNNPESTRFGSEFDILLGTNNYASYFALVERSELRGEADLVYYGSEEDTMDLGVGEEFYSLYNIDPLSIWPQYDPDYQGENNQ